MTDGVLLEAGLLRSLLVPASMHTQLPALQHTPSSIPHNKDEIFTYFNPTDPFSSASFPELHEIRSGRRW